MDIKNVYTTSEISEIINRNNKYIIRFVINSDILIDGTDYRKTIHGNYLFNEKVKEEILSHQNKLDDSFNQKMNDIDITTIGI